MTKRSLAGLCALVSAVWVWLFLPTSMVHAAPSQAPTEIEHLLVFVASSGCTFHRNGSDHESADAADHLRLKYSRGKRYADSAEHFIDRLASKSSWTGKPYTVTCANQTEPSGEWLSRELERYRAASISSPSGETEAAAGT
ncbi:MAG: DUF5329 domain-containing protein [Halioglobus sp.]